VIPILAIFFLSDGEKLTDQIIHLVWLRKKNHGALESLAGELHAMNAALHPAQVTLGGLSPSICSIAMLLLAFRTR